MSITNLSPADLRKAATLIEKIEALNAKLSKIIGAAPAPAVVEAKKARKKHKMSAAGRAKIREAQKARWAKLKAAKAA